MHALDSLPSPAVPQANGQTYIVGGAVRDALLNIKSKDHDWVVVGSAVDEMLSKGFEQVGADFPVFLHPNTKEEYALARTERKAGSGYKGFQCDTNKSVTLEEDLERRDLTINAMAYSQHTGLVDPYNGQSDLHDKKLRHVSKAFTEDPLRVLRVARFAARFANKGFLVAEETLQLMLSMVHSGELSNLTPERVWHETQRALTEPMPWVYFEVLRSCDALNIVMPELNALFGIPQPEKHHPEIDCGVHALLSLKAATEQASTPSVCFAALIHDLGKALTPSELWPKHHGHEQLGLKPIKSLCDRLKTDKYTKRLALLTCEYHTHIHRALELRAETVYKVLKACDALRINALFEDILHVACADARGRTGLEQTPYPQADFFRSALTVVQSELIDIQTLREKGLEGKALGEAIDQARIRAIKNWQQSAKPC